MGLLPGVYATKKKNGSIYYRSSITYRKKHISLGSFDQEEKAHNAYKEASFLLNHQEISLSSYQENSCLSHDKWVSLLNFRDNHVYFKNPLYLKRNYFLYYLSPHIELKFDIDDLFYYSTKKIMRRGNHLFVNDYGMQFGILNRYGIKSHAVLGKDYRFINGDTSDFRYENIEVLNRFHGITRIPLSDGKRKPECGKESFRYKVRIHIRSYYVVGSYETETEAAVAYNKAVDVLKKNGINRSFPLNYIEGLSPAAYAELYSHVKLSPAIYAIKPEGTSISPSNPQS